ncbi:MAG TPA: hypothetical protein V6D27_15165, partial [Vampirovibrionales bacterium]
STPWRWKTLNFGKHLVSPIRVTIGPRIQRGPVQRKGLSGVYSQANSDSEFLNQELPKKT